MAGNLHTPDETLPTLTPVNFDPRNLRNIGNLQLVVDDGVPGEVRNVPVYESEQNLDDALTSSFQGASQPMGPELIDLLRGHGYDVRHEQHYVPATLEDGRQMGANGRLIVGDKGKIISRNYDNVLIPDSRAAEYGKPPKTLERSPGHYKEFSLACKGGKPAGSNFDFAGPLTEAVLLGNVALRLAMREELTQKTLLWDSPNLRFTNSDTANQFLRREYRQGWTLG